MVPYSSNKAIVLDTSNIPQDDIGPYFGVHVTAGANRLEHDHAQTPKHRRDGHNGHKSACFYVPSFWIQLGQVIHALIDARQGPTDWDWSPSGPTIWALEGPGFCLHRCLVLEEAFGAEGILGFWRGRLRKPSLTGSSIAALGLVALDYM